MTVGSWGAPKGAPHEPTDNIFAILSRRGLREPGPAPQRQGDTSDECHLLRCSGPVRVRAALAAGRRLQTSVPGRRHLELRGARLQR